MPPRVSLTIPLRVQTGVKVLYRGVTHVAYEFPYKLDRAKKLSITERICDVWSLNREIPKLAQFWAKDVQIPIGKWTFERQQLTSIPSTTLRGDHFDPCLIVEEVTTAFKLHSVDCVVGGSLAVMIYTLPRVTKDVDFNIDLQSGPDTNNLLRCICSENDWELVSVNTVTPSAKAAPMLPLLKIGWAVVNVRAVHVDLFFNDWTPSNVVHELAYSVPTPSGPDIQLSPLQCIAFFKTLSFRPNSKRARKDANDVIDLLDACPDMNRAWVRNMLVQCQGDDGPSVAQWDTWVLEADSNSE